jgi:hypothetical protein
MRLSRAPLATFAAVSGTLALLGLISLNTGAALPLPVPLGLTSGVDEAAFRALAPPADLPRAETKAHLAIRLSPYQNNARLRLAYIDTLKAGRLSTTGEAEFRRSYDLLPIDADVAAWRIRFGLEHWQELTPASREAVYREAMAFSKVGSHDVNVPAILDSISNPSGRLAAALWRQSLKHNQR